MYVNRDHVISIELSAEEWRAFLQVQPQPVAWLRARIQESIAHVRQHGRPRAEDAAQVQVSGV